MSSNGDADALQRRCLHDALIQHLSSLSLSSNRHDCCAALAGIADDGAKSNVSLNIDIMPIILLILAFFYVYCPKYKVSFSAPKPRARIHGVQADGLHSL